MSAEKHLTRTATAYWAGSLSEGEGSIDLESGALSNHPYSFKSRFEDGEGEKGTNPEELLAAAHSGCFAMQLSHFLAKAGHPPKRLEVRGEVRLNKENGGYEISSSLLRLDVVVPGMNKEEVLEWAEKAKNECPMSKALKAIEIALEVHVPNH